MQDNGETVRKAGLQQAWLFPRDDSSSSTRSTKRQPRQPAPLPVDAIEALRNEVAAHFLAMHHRLDALEDQISGLVTRTSTPTPEKEFYSTLEAARLLGKRPYTVREWCRLKRVNAEKTWSGRGQDDEWRISRAELLRIQNEGLLPLDKPGRTRPPRKLPR